MSELEGRHPGWDLALRLALGDRGEAVVRFLDERTERKRRRAERMYDSAIAHSGLSDHEFFEAVQSDERVADNFELAVEAATQTSWDTKVRLLGRAVALGLGDDAAIDHSELLRSAVADMEPVHARALWFFGQSDKFGAPLGQGIEGVLIKAFPRMEPIAHQVVAMLQRHGLLSEPFFNNGVTFVTPLGRELLSMLQEEGVALDARVKIDESGAETDAGG